MSIEQDTGKLVVGSERAHGGRAPLLEGYPQAGAGHHKRMRWQRDAGLRLDHLLLSPNLRDRLEDAGVDREVRGREGASDHAPVWIRLSRA